MLAFQLEHKNSIENGKNETERQEREKKQMLMDEDIKQTQINNAILTKELGKPVEITKTKVEK